METVKLMLMIDPADAGDVATLRPLQRAALIRARLLEIHTHKACGAGSLATSPSRARSSTHCST